MEKQNIKIKRKVLTLNKDCEVNFETIVPDVKPDIVAILNTNANTYICKEECTLRNFKISGNIDTYVIYLSDTGETRSLNVTLDFLENFENEKIVEGIKYKTCINLKSIESKILNERKISIVAILEITIEFYEIESLELIKSFEEISNIQKKEASYKIKNFIGCGTSKTSLKESMEVESNEIISEIMRTEINVKSFENKVSYNKVLSKSDVEITVVYQTESLKVASITKTYPVMSFVDIENVLETYICDTDLKLKNMLFKINSTSTSKVDFQLDFDVSIDVYESKEISIIEDMYSLEKEIKFDKKDFDVMIDSNINKEKINITEKVFIEDIGNIVDDFTKVNVINRTVSGTYCNYELETEVNLMYELDNKNQVTIRKFKFPFMIKVEEQSNSKTQFYISKKDFKLNGEEVSCNIEIEYFVEQNNYKKVSVLENIEETEMLNPNEYSMVVYFVKPCDTIWKIAKMFKVTMQSIIDANNLENPDKINIGDKLYIVK